MNERERWIVYPLLFFALGASLRDKFLQHVATKEIQCTRLVAKQIACEELNVTDSAKPDRIVAKLTSGAPSGESEKADRFGVLILLDSEGKELCGVTNNMLQVRQIGCEEAISRNFIVVDAQNPNQPLARLTSATSTAPDKSTRRVGSLLLTDDRGAEIFGLANDQLHMRGIVCQGIAIINPEKPGDVLAAIGSAIATPEGGGDPTRIGLLELNKQRFSGVRGTPSQTPIETPPPPTPQDAAPKDDAPAPDAPAKQDSSAPKE